MARTPKNTNVLQGSERSYVAYYRVSTARQGESGLGLDAQRSAVERFLHSSKGLLAEEFTEIESGKRNDRPELASAIQSAKKRKAVLLIAKLDRLARNVAFISNLMESAAEFVAADMPHANRLTIHILAAIAEHEAAMISARTVAALAEAKKKGVALGNPRWNESIAKARAARKKTRPVELEALLASYRDEALSLRQIAGRLNALGVKTPSGGAVWHASTVRAASAKARPIAVPYERASAAAELLRTL
jgi:DNA invertase Pin-like site-specific DNA recombinase